MEKSDWIAAFKAYLRERQVTATERQLDTLAEKSFLNFAQMDPLKVAQVEFDFWPANHFPDTEWGDTL